jgi:hypothetical protein
MEDLGKHPDTIVHDQQPLNVESPLGPLRESFLTPTELFYIRSRGLERKEAERLLVGGFLQVVSGRLVDSPFLHDAVSAALERELELALA